MKQHLKKHQRLIALILCTITLLVLTAFESFEPKDNDDTFWRNFVTYFRASQPKQVITKDVYKKPPEGISVAVPIIVYHGVRPNYTGETSEVKRYTIEPQILDRELAYLHDNKYNVISLTELYKYFDDGVPLPPKPIVLTFDDGWKNQYIYAFPLLKKYGFTATFFIFTNAIGHKNFLSWDQVKEMNDAGMTIGGHTKTHPYLTRISDPTLLEKEISGGKQIIEEHLGHPIDTFAYPFGLYNATTTRAVAKAGYKTARTSRPGLWHTNKELLVLTAIYDQNSNMLFSRFVDSSNQIAKLFDKRPLTASN